MFLNTGHEYANVDVTIATNFDSGTASMAFNDEDKTIYLNMQPISPSGKCEFNWFRLKDITKYLCVVEWAYFAIVSQFPTPKVLKDQYSNFKKYSINYTFLEK